MSVDNQNQAPIMDLDADAVCGQCGTVNPEGTLICKVCGNNLRDQRSLRLQADQVLESVGEAPSATRWFTGILTALGAVLVLLVALNVNSIANYVVAGGVDVAGTDVLWVGPQHAAFDALRDQAKGTVATADTVSAALAALEPVPEGEDVPIEDGVYALVAADAGENDPPLGTAALKREGEEYAFAAVLADGSEVRGWATQRSNGLLTAEAMRAAVLENGEYKAVYGYAQRESDGTFSGWGQHQDSEGDLLGFVVFRLP